MREAGLHGSRRRFAPPHHEENHLFPHPVLAIVLLPSRQPAMTELQEQAVTVRDQSAAADVAKREIDLVAGTPAHILQRLPQRPRALPGIHAEGERRVVRQGRDEGQAGWCPAEWLRFAGYSAQTPAPTT